jgi:primosomal protein N' (replication factor Y)
MDIVTVYPLAKGLRAETLDYYSPQSLSIGTVVSVPIGSRTEDAVVAASDSTAAKRSQVRSAEYELKPINFAKDQKLLPQFIAAAKKFSAFSAATTGAVLRSLTPQAVITDEKTNAISQEPEISEVTAPSPSIIQARDNQQHTYIESLTTGHVNNQGSVFVCAPTIRDCQKLKDVLSAHDPVVLHGSLKKTQQRQRWNRISGNQTPQVIIGTAPFLSVPITDLARIFVYHESDSAFKMNRRPYLNKELFARFLAAELRVLCTLTDTVLPTETQWEYKTQSLTPEFQPDFHRTDSLDTKLIDMTERSQDNDSGVHVFASETVRLIRSAKEQNKHILLFVARKGRRPFTACNDCGDILRCSKCQLPLVLVDDNDDNQRKFICKTCGDTEDADTRCRNCNSWRLQALGIGIDFVTDILKEHTDTTPIHQLDTDTQKTASEQDKVLSDFRDQESGILVTTKSGVNALNDPVDGSAVVTADALLAIPDLNVSQELFSLLISLRDKTKSTFLIQTRSNNTGIFSAALDGDIDSFYGDDINQREQFNYPPFSRLIKLRIPPKQSRGGLTTEIKNTFSQYEPQAYPARNKSSETNILIRVDRSDWVDDKLLNKLRNLPLAVSINAHPRSLL